MAKTVNSDVSIPDGLETAFVIQKIDEIAETARQARIYIGDEFCDRLLPTPAMLERALENADGRKLTLLTPLCAVEGLRKLEALLKYYPVENEVVVNDWGVLALCCEMGLSVVLGRLLVACNRDPRLYENLPDPDSSFREYIRSSSLNSTEFQDFLLENNIYRVELDNIMQSYNYSLHPEIKASLHLPYVYISTTRKCLVRYALTKEPSPWLKITDCERECRSGYLISRTAGYETPIYIRGNTHFYFNDRLPEQEVLERLNIDRIVCSLAK